jgi:hypothetical protein
MKNLQSSVCNGTGGMGVFIGAIARLPRVGSGAHIEVEGWVYTFLLCTTSMIPEFSSSLPPLHCHQV